MSSVQDDHQVHRAQRVTENAHGASSVSVLCHGSHRRAGQNHDQKRIHLAHHGIRKNIDILQGRANSYQSAAGVQGRVRGRSQRSGLSDDQGI